MNNRHLGRLATFVSAAVVAICPLLATANPFEGGWKLDASASILRFESSASRASISPHRFTALEGLIAEDGATTVTVGMKSVETGQDMRDVRLRFLLFEAFRFPEARISAALDVTKFEMLERTKRMRLSLPFTLELHGVERKLNAEVVATLLSDRLVSVASVKPVPIRLADFEMGEGLVRLQDAYEGRIEPVGRVSFDFMFNALDPNTPMTVAEQISPEACEAELTAVTKSQQVIFRKGSHQVDEESLPILSEVAEIAAKCQEVRITVEGHTDSRGREALNQALSEKRAKSVTKYLVSLGLPEARLTAEGLGEAHPIVPNDTAENRAKNRRIEFHIEQHTRKTGG